jgi:hypothetical protein
MHQQSKRAVATNRCREGSAMTPQEILQQARQAGVVLVRFENEFLSYEKSTASGSPMIPWRAGAFAWSRCPHCPECQLLSPPTTPLLAFGVYVRPWMLCKPMRCSWLPWGLSWRSTFMCTNGCLTDKIRRDFFTLARYNRRPHSLTIMSRDTDSQEVRS